MVCRLILSRVASPEVNVGGCQVVDGLAVTMVVVVIDKAIELGLEMARQIVVLEQDAVLQRLVPALNLPWVWGWKGAPRTCLNRGR